MSDNHAKIEAILRRYAEDLGPNLIIVRKTRIEGDLGLDSLDRLEIGLKLEEAFNIDIPDDDLDAPEMGTFGGLCDYIDRRMEPISSAKLIDMLEEPGIAAAVNDQGGGRFA